MKIKQTMRTLLLSGLLLVPVVFATVGLSGEVSALGNNGCEVDTSIIKCEDVKEGDNVPVENTGLWSVLRLVINILIAGVGVLALAGIVYGAVLYTSAGGNTEQVKKAMGIFTNVVIGVVAFAGMWVLLNFLIPGGAFNL